MKRKASDFIPNERYEHLIILPIGIDFRDPRKRIPFTEAMTREQRKREIQMAGLICGSSLTALKGE